MKRGNKRLLDGLSFLLALLIIPRIATATPGTPVPLIRIENSESKTVAQSTSNSNESMCPAPILSRLQRHRIASGETIASIAGQYNLLPETLIRLNPILKGGSPPVGKEILIPPFNGVRIEVPKGATWKDLEAAYGVRADVLFEMNGCQKIPKVVFVPGVTWSPRETRSNNYTGLSGYPLPTVAKIGLGYGWQTSPTNQQRLFHSGVDLLAEPGTPVLVAESGIVAYVGIDPNYGNFVIINHDRDLQTRYAHLSQIQVKIGQSVKTGDGLGRVGVTGKPDLLVPHLHFEVRYKLPVGWVAQDPMIHLQKKFISSPP